MRRQLLKIIERLEAARYEELAKILSTVFEKGDHWQVEELVRIFEDRI